MRKGNVMAVNREDISPTSAVGWREETCPGALENLE